MKLDPLSCLIENQKKSIMTEGHTNRADPTFIPVFLDGGIGDVICAVPAIEFLASKFSICCYSDHSEAFNYFSKTVKCLPGKIPNFTWHLYFNTVARFVFFDGFSGFELPEHKELYKRQRELFLHNPAFHTMVDKHPLNDTTLARYAKYMKLNRQSLPLHSLGFEEMPNFSKNRRKPPNNYIVVHDGFDTSMLEVIPGRSTKQWSLNHWQSLVKTIKEKHPGLQIIQLGSKTSREIDGVDKCLINDTSLTEAFDIISESKILIDGDSGLVHAATHLGVPCVVMFGPTPDYFFGYPENINMRSSFCSDACFWLKKDWMKNCPIDYSAPLCMDAIEPNDVYFSVKCLLLK